MARVSALFKAVIDLGGDAVDNLRSLGYLTEESAQNPTAVKTAQTKYRKALTESPAMRRREAERLGVSQFEDADLGPEQIIQPEGLLGSTLIPVFGDKTVTGRTITAQRGRLLDTPVESHGGARFAQQQQGTGRGYMSMETAAKSKQKNVDFAAERTGSDDIVGVFTGGADPSYQFAAPMADLMFKQTMDAGVPKAALREFDKTLRQVRPDWVGMESPDALSQLLGTGDYPMEGAGALRIAFTEEMSKARWRDQGFGVPQDAIEVITEPGLLGAARGDSGLAMIDMQPGAETIKAPGLHQSYNTIIQGDYAGGLGRSVPAPIMFPDTFAFMQREGRSPSSQLGSLMMDPKLYQKADENWLTGILDYLAKNPTALSAAGAAGLLGAAAPEEAEAGFISRGGKTLLEAFHGSPYQFEKFSTDYIGTGEGAQAYGHGLYFADSEDVARGYREELNKLYSTEWTLGDERVPAWVVEAVDSGRGDSVLADFNKRAAEADAMLAGGTVNQPHLVSAQRDEAERMISVINRLQRGEKATPPGALYRAEIDVSPESLLDWDKPLSEQSEAVKKAVNESLNIRGTQLLNDKKGLTVVGPDGSGKNIVGIQADTVEDAFDQLTGERIYNLLGDQQIRNLDMNYSPVASQKLATGLLSNKGIKGVKYYDAASRSTAGGEILDVYQQDGKWRAKTKVKNRSVGFSNSPTGAVTTSRPFDTEAEARQWAENAINENLATSNYVIFDDSLLNIAERGAADPRLLGGTALGTAGILGAIEAGQRADNAMAVAPRSETLQQINMGLRDVERRLEGSPASLLFPEGLVNYLETVNRPYEDPTMLTRAMALIDLL